MKRMAGIMMVSLIPFGAAAPYGSGWKMWVNASVTNPQNIPAAPPEWINIPPDKVYGKKWDCLNDTPTVTKLFLESMKTSLKVDPLKGEAVNVIDKPSGYVLGFYKSSQLISIGEASVHCFPAKIDPRLFDKQGRSTGRPRGWTMTR
ncbi:MAG: hypothetical protein HYR52_01125 [Candidatus Tectomicrobia bacterium]|nr:hypothetical protein [Candidatus Tectomicrobia bacterium]